MEDSYNRLSRYSKINILNSQKMFLHKKAHSVFTNIENSVECVYSGYKNCYLNHIFGGRLDGESFYKEALKIISYFAQNDASCTWILQNENYGTDQIVEKIKSIGFDCHLETVAMFFDFSNELCEIATPSGFEFRIVATDGEFVDFAKIYIGFVLNVYKKEMGEHFASLLGQKAYLDKSLKYFVGYKNGKPVTIR